MVWLKAWGPACLLMALIYLFSSFPKNEIADFGAWDLWVKKGGHVAEYAILALAYWRGLTYTRPATWRLAALAVGMAVAYAITDEVHQSFVPGRLATPTDVVIDAVGASLGIIVWRSRQCKLPRWL